MRTSKYESVSILSAFVDIRGSGVFRQRMLHEGKPIDSFWAKFDELVDAFELDHEYHVKHLGDGFLCNAKLNGKSGAQTVRFLNELWAFLQKAERLFKRCDPGPDGIRVHIASGDAIQTIQSNGELIFHGYHLDLIGTTIKTEAFRSVHFAVHASARDIMSPSEIERARFSFQTLPPPELRRASEKVYEQDMGLMFEFKKR